VRCVINTTNNIVEVPFTKEMTLNANAKANSLGSIDNSILDGKGNFAGYLGEEIVADYMKALQISTDEGDEKYSYDLVKDNQKIEVKTKRRTVPPKGFYDASVAVYSRHQNPDIYVFVSLQYIDNVPVKAWICGQKDSEEYFKEATFYSRGDVDPSNNWVVSVDCYNLPYKELDRVTPNEQ